MAIFNGKITAAALPPLTASANISSIGTATTIANTMASNLYYGGGGGGGASGTGAFYGAGGAGGGGQYIMANGTSTTWTIPNHKMSPLIINGQGNTELVRLNHDGTVTWADTINVDEAAKAFGQVLTLSVENSAGLTYAVKQRMRDTVFEEIISMAKDRGSLTADDLTYLHQAAKIIDKLKGKE